MAELKQFEEKVDKMVKDHGELKTGISDIKAFLQNIGERLSQAESDQRVCRDVLRDLLLESRAKEYRAQVEAKLSRPPSLVFSRPNGSAAALAEASVEALTDFISEKFESEDVPDFVIEPMGKRGSYKLIPETYSPMEGRRICASILQAIKPAEKKHGKKSKEDLKSRFGLNAFYDNPLFLREIRSSALRFVAQMLQDQGIKLVGKPFVRRDVMILNDIPMFPEYLVPAEESLWAPAFSFLGDTLRAPPANFSDTPVAQAIMEDLFVAGKGMLFPKVNLSNPVAPAPVPMAH
jgi:hypothetical protein